MRAARSKPDPRIARSRRRVLEAALEELGAVGYGAFAIERVAARSGVAKSTIYRLWRGKLELVADAFQSFHRDAGPDLAGASPRERLVRIVRHVAEVVAGPPFSACLPALVDAAERDADLRAFHHRFQAEARRPLESAVADLMRDAGGSGDDAPLVASALLGAIFYRRLMTDGPLQPGEAEPLVEAWLKGSGPAVPGA